MEDKNTNVFMEQEKPDYAIKAYACSGVYKVIKFKRKNGIYIKLDNDKKEKSESKLDHHISRA
jgi:hypothetical protein